jgi:dTDP-4-amino-4,6-dideoxygalactose transaminase
MSISKQANASSEFTRKWFDFDRARDAFEYYLRQLKLADDEIVLLPNYIGFSEREGSGVFDPVIRSGVSYSFYEMDEILNINVDSIISMIESKKIKLIVVIHYFGYVDPNYDKIIKIARKSGIKVLEDQAHSFFTDICGGITGRLCDASIYSLHKMFPVATGGALSLTSTSQDSHAVNVSILNLEHDVGFMANRRILNATILNKRLIPHDQVLTVLRPYIDSGVVPQTFPVLINDADRNEIYFKMNELGYGVVSLYHTMIDEISKNQNYVTNSIAKSILNLPVHQDASEQDLNEMCDSLLSMLYGNS